MTNASHKLNVPATLITVVVILLTPNSGRVS
jgi:hypothetical protein